MNNDYLWDKTGHDPEIEHLEQALRSLKFSDAVPPALPVKVVPFAEIRAAKYHGFVSYAMAAAACLMFAAVSFGIWMQFAAGESENDVAATNAPAKQIGILPNDDAVINPPVTNTKESEHLVPARQVKLKTSNPFTAPATVSAAHRNVTKARNARPVKNPVRLTKEEVYAYSQLKLALSITGSKLKLISDKIESPHDKNSASENTR